MGKDKLKVLGVNAGVGVCLYPFKINPNFKVIGNIEPRGVFYTKCQTQWKANFGGLPMVRQIKDLSNEKPDVIIGHPDCGDSSILRMSRSKKLGNVLSNLSLNIFIESINHFNPSYFLLENLPGLLNVLTIEDIQKRLNGAYKLYYRIGSVSQWGNSQVSRVRLVLVGIREERIAKDYNPFDQLGLGNQNQLKNAEYFELGDVQQPDFGHVRENNGQMTNLYVKDGRRKITYLEARSIWSSLGGQAQRWPVGGAMKNQPGVTRNTVGRPPLTVRKQNRQFGTEGYVLSPREMANIQGVPLCFKIMINLERRVYWLNKSRTAVTKCMPYEIPVWFMNRLLTLK